LTLVDRLIPFYVWFLWGFGLIAIAMGITNFCVNLITMLTVKQIYVPLGVGVLLSILMVGFCIFVGWFFEKYKIWDRITSHTQRKANPEIRLIVSELAEIRETLCEIKGRLE